MAMNKKEVPLVIIGGGITGLAVAAYLEKAGADYFLAEGTPEFGGLTRGQVENGIHLDYGLKSLPVYDSLEAHPLLQLKKHLGLKCAVESDNSPTMTLEKTGFTEFMGFGEAKDRNLVDEMAYYTASPRLWISGGWQNLVQELSEQIPVRKKILRSQVVRLELENGAVKAAHINGDSILTSPKFIWTLHPHKLLELLPTNTLSQRDTKTLTKNAPFTVVSLDLVTDKSMSDMKNTILLQAPGEEEMYVVGRFVSNVDLIRQGPKQISSWLTLVDAEKAEDEEEVSKLIRQMKRLIQKAFPQVMESKPWERIIVATDALGSTPHFKLEEDGLVPGLKNLWACGAALDSQYRHLTSSLSTAMKTAALFSQGAPSECAEQSAEVSP